jgi:transcription elongation factor Elf1
VILDEPSTSMHAHPDNHRIVILGHPIESMILEELGFTAQSVALGGRLLFVQNVACRACGTMYETRRVGADSAWLGGSGCLVLLLISFAVGIVVARYQESYLLGFVAGWLALIALFSLVSFVLTRYVRWRYHDRVKEFDHGPGCPKCGSKSYSAFPPRWGTLMCPKCGKQSVRVRVVGIS